MIDAAELFHHIADWQIIVSKASRSGVWPDHIHCHSTDKHHGIARKEAIAISNEVEAWAGVARARREFEVPLVKPRTESWLRRLTWRHQVQAGQLHEPALYRITASHMYVFMSNSLCKPSAWNLTFSERRQTLRIPHRQTP